MISHPRASRGVAGARATSEARISEYRSYGASLGLRRVEVRRADEDLHSAGSESLEHGERGVDRRRAIIDAGEEVRVDVDHPRAARASARTDRAPFRSIRLPTTTTSAPASRAARTA